MVATGHEDIIRRALRFSDRVLVAVSHDPSQSKKGLFSVDERVAAIREVFAGESAISAEAFSGLLVEFARARGASVVVRGLRNVLDFEYEMQMALVNRELAGDLETVFLAPAAENAFLSSTLIRQVSGLGGDVSRFVSEPVQRRIQALQDGRAG
jgi:pantetheine-phosphate adenylyltransferase